MNYSVWYFEYIKYVGRGEMRLLYNYKNKILRSNLKSMFILNTWNFLNFFVASLLRILVTDIVS